MAVKTRFKGGKVSFILFTFKEQYSYINLQCFVFIVKKERKLSDPWTNLMQYLKNNFREKIKKATMRPLKLKKNIFILSKSELKPPLIIFISVYV